MSSPSYGAVHRALLALFAVMFALLTVGAPGAAAATPVDTVAEELRKDPVYVAPGARNLLSEAEEKRLTDQIEDADKPVFVAVLPEDQPTDRLFRDLRTLTGITGVYGVSVGERFDARADSSVLSGGAVGNLSRAVQDQPAGDRLDTFVDQAVEQADGDAPSSWDNGGQVGEENGRNSGGGGALVFLAALALLGGAAYYLVSRRKQRRREQEQRESLERMRVVVDEDITAYGEELERLDFSPAEKGADDAMRGDWTRALDAYEKAKQRMAAARAPGDVRPVTEALEEGRFALAVLAARREGRELPERRPPCFFDPRHGPSVADVRWHPSGGSERDVPVCAADRTRLEEGRDPLVRQVDSPWGRRPYYDAGPAYGPWAGGYFGAFGGGLLPGLLVGTMLGGMMATPGYAAEQGDVGSDMGGGDSSGGDFSGGDFSGGDFGGGFGGGDGGGFGGGDFGGGF